MNTKKNNINKTSLFQNRFADYSKALFRETKTDGFIYGYHTDHFANPEGCTSGDGFVLAPDGSVAGIAWEVGEKPWVSPDVYPNLRGWGGFDVIFPKPIKTMDDLIYNFRSVLPILKQRYKKAIKILEKEKQK